MSEAQEVGRLAVCEPINALGAMTALFPLYGMYTQSKLEGKIQS